MTERLWWRSTDPNPLFLFVQKYASERKRRLLACACCREMGREIKDERFWRLIDLGEQWADGEYDPKRDWEGFWETQMAAHRARDEAGAADNHDTCIALCYAIACVSELDPLYLCVQPVPSVWGRLREVGRNLADWYRLGVSYRKRQPHPQSWCEIIRDIFGNPFRPVSIDPAWRTVAAVALATGIYDDRAFDRMPILADALEDAGCDCDDIFNHLRDPHATHVRGCWALDLVLGKS